MGQWTIPQQKKTLVKAVEQLNPKAKQAMYGAARAQTIHKGTWNGCAFNKAGMELGNKHVESIGAAAELFGLAPQAVSNFINAWDSLPGEEKESTAFLIETIEKVGLFTEAGETKGRRVVRETLFKNVNKALFEEFEKQLEKGEVEGVCEAGELLFANA